MKLFKKHRTAILACLSVLLVSLLVLRQINEKRMNEPLDSYGARISAMIDATDADSLYAAMHEEERLSADLSIEEFEALLKWYRDATAGAKKSGDLQLEVGQQGYALGATQMLSMPNGTPVHVQFAAERTDRGPRSSVLNGIVLAGIQAKYGDRHANEHESVRLWLVLADGLAAERGFFESIGLNGLPQETVEAPLRTWSAYQDFARKNANRARQNIEDTAAAQRRGTPE